MAYNRDHFFETVRAAHGPLKASQVEGFNAILAEAELRHFDKRSTAYVLATAWWESDKAMQPVPEIGRGDGRPYGVPDPETGQTYYGRGLVQLTWKTNYAKMAKLVGVDLVAHPDLALELGIAVDILFDGMQLGTFTGKRLVDYFTATTTDWTGARHIVNGTDHAADIAALAVGFGGALVEIPATSVSAAAPAPAKPAPAPVAAAPASSSATTKAATMTASINPTVTPAATANPVANFLSGILGGIKTKLEDTAAALENGTASAASATTAATNAVSSAPDAIAAAEDIAKLVVEVETHDWTDIPGTFMDFVNRAIAILGKFKVVLPELTVAQSILSKFTGPAPAKAA